MKITIALVTAILLIFLQVSFSQDTTETCKIVKKYPNGSYLVQIGNETFLTITETMERNILKQKRDLLDTQKELLLKDSLLINYDQTLAWYDSTIVHMKDYIFELEAMMTGYKTLAQNYKNLKEPRFTYNIGLGATGRSKKPSILIGAGIYSLRVWGFLQEHNSGAFVGKSFPLFK